MIQFGTALKCQEPPFHRCLILSDPTATDGLIVLVRVTTDDGTWPDRDCILTPKDWTQLEHVSTVAYSTCKYGPATSSLEAAIRQGLFEVIPSPPKETLRKIIAAGHSSSGMPPAAKRLLARI